MPPSSPVPGAPPSGMTAATAHMTASRSVREDEERVLTELDRSWSNMSISDSFDREAAARQSHDHRLTLGATLGIDSRGAPSSKPISFLSPAPPQNTAIAAPPTVERMTLDSSPVNPVQTAKAPIPRTFPLLGQLFGIEHQPASVPDEPDADSASAPVPALRGPALLSKHSRARASGPGSPLSPDNAPPRKRAQRPQSMPLGRKMPSTSQPSTLRPRSTCTLPPGRTDLLAPSRPSFVHTSSGTRMPQWRLPTRSARPDRPNVVQPPCPPELTTTQRPQGSLLSPAAPSSALHVSSPLARPVLPDPPLSAVTVTDSDDAPFEPAVGEEDEDTDAANVSTELGAFFFQPSSPDNSIELAPSSSSFSSSFGGAGFALNNKVLPNQQSQQQRNRIPLLSAPEPEPSTGPGPSNSFSSDSDSSFPGGLAPPEIRLRGVPSLQDTLAIPHRGARRCMSDAFASSHPHSPRASRAGLPPMDEIRRTASDASTRAPASHESSTMERGLSSGLVPGSSNTLPARRGLLFDTLVPPGDAPANAIIHGSPSFLGALAAMNGDQSGDQEQELPTGTSMSFTASQSGVSTASGSMFGLRATPVRRRNSWDAISPSSTMDRLAGQPTLGVVDGSPAGLGPALSLALPPRTPSADDSSPLIHTRRRMILGGQAAAEAAATGVAASTALPPAEGSPRPAPSPGGALGGFGASEKEGKVLPSYTVKDDGLVRITPDTMASLLQGEYDHQVAGYTVVDCRFPYEHSGGAVKGSVNLSSVKDVLSHLLTPGRGLHTNQPLPQRQTSGSQGKKHVLIFHCEFSAKRGPTLALALRAQDRAQTQEQDYPACHFPELYILAGGYSTFYAAHPEHCFPQAYVPMDDPRYAQQCAMHLDMFRRNVPRPGLRAKQLRPHPLPASEGSDGSPLGPQLRPRRGLHMRAASSIAPLASRGAFGLAASMARPRLPTVDSPGPDESPLEDSPLGGSPLAHLRPAQGTDTSPLAPQAHRRSLAPLAPRPLALSPLAPRQEARQDAREGRDSPRDVGEMPLRRSSRGFAHPALESTMDLPRSLGAGSFGRASARGLARPAVGTNNGANTGHAPAPGQSQDSSLGTPFQRPRRLLRTGTAPVMR